MARILTNSSNAATKDRIEKCDVLIIDEIGLLSAKAFDGIENICRQNQLHRNIIDYITTF